MKRCAESSNRTGSAGAGAVGDGQGVIGAARAVGRGHECQRIALSLAAGPQRRSSVPAAM